MPNDWTDLRKRATAAKQQMEDGPQEWPGRPSRQRLELFLAASPEVVLQLLDELESTQTPHREEAHT